MNHFYTLSNYDWNIPWQWYCGCRGSMELFNSLRGQQFLLSYCSHMALKIIIIIIKHIIGSGDKKGKHYLELIVVSFWIYS